MQERQSIPLIQKFCCSHVWQVTEFCEVLTIVGNDNIASCSLCTLKLKSILYVISMEGQSRIKLFTVCRKNQNVFTHHANQGIYFLFGMVTEYKPHVGIREIGSTHFNGSCKTQCEYFLCFFCMFTLKCEVKKNICIKEYASHRFRIYCICSSFMSSSVSLMQPRLLRSLVGIFKSFSLILFSASSGSFCSFCSIPTVEKLLKNTRTLFSAVSLSSNGFISRNSSARSCTFVISIIFIFRCKISK